MATGVRKHSCLLAGAARRSARSARESAARAVVGPVRAMRLAFAWAPPRHPLFAYPPCKLSEPEVCYQRASVVRYGRPRSGFPPAAVGTARDTSHYMELNEVKE